MTSSWSLILQISDKFVEKLETHIVRSITFFLKSCLLLDNVETSCRVGQAIEDNIAHAHCVLVPAAKNTHKFCLILIDFHCNNGCENAPHCDVLCTLPAMFGFEVVHPVCT